MRPAKVLVAVFVMALTAGVVVGRSLPDDAVVAAAVPPTTAPPAPARVLLAGDSVMAGLVPAVEAALEPTGRATVDFVLTPAILRDPSIRFSWGQDLDRLDPDLVVMFVGTWEDREVRLPGSPAADALPEPTTSSEPPSSGTVDPGSPAWTDQYRNDVVDPWLDLITRRGARVLWIGAPPVPDGERQRFFDDLNTVFSELPDDWSQVAYLDPGAALGRGGDGFASIVRLPDGTDVRLRQIDGLHLCPSGSQLLAELVVRQVEAQLGVSAVDGWQEGPWRADAGLFPAEGCPTPTAEAA